MVPVFKAKTIKPTKTVGQRLRSARQKKQLSLEQAEQLTKVKLKYLDALEEDRYDLLPTEVYSLGFLRCYAEALNLKTANLLDQYRHERQAIDSAKNTPVISLAPSRRLSSHGFLITPKTLLSIGSAVVVIGLIAYIAGGVVAFLAPPNLKIFQPEPDSRVTSNNLIVAGVTDPAVSLSINGELVTVDPAGQFKREIALNPGLNTLEFVAINRIGKETRAVRHILAEYQPPATPSPMNPTASPSPTTTPSATPTASPAVSPSPTPQVTASPTNNPE